MSITAILPSTTVHDREREDADGTPVRHHDHTRGAVGQGGPRDPGEVGATARPRGHGTRTDRHPALGTRHHVRVEHGDRRVEVAFPRRREERVHDLPLPRQVGIGRGRPALDPAPGSM